MRAGRRAAVLAALLAAAARAAGPTPHDVRAVLDRLGVTLKLARRPAWPKPPCRRLAVRLHPQIDEPGPHTVSFGLPFGPGWLADHGNIRVLRDDGSEIPAFTQPLAHWWIDGKQGSPRSVLVQFDVPCADRSPRAVTITWDRPRTCFRKAATPAADTQFTRRATVPAGAEAHADAFDFPCPKVLALLPPAWLCASLVVWQQVPAAANTAAPWFDRHLVEQFDGSTVNLSANRARYEAHLFDRPATYAKVYARHGGGKYLLAALKAGEFYIRHLGADGFFDVKPGRDVKYVYAEGPAVLYLLTGDARFARAVDRAVRAWDTHKRIEYTGSGFWTERHAGFGMAACVHAYELTGRRALLDKARRYFDAAFAMQLRPGDGKPPDGAWVHSAESHGDGNGWTTSPWMSCFLADAIWKYWLLTGDPRAPASLALYAKFTERHALRPDGRSLYYMANSPGRGTSIGGGGPEHNVEGVYLLAMGYYLSGRSDEALPRKIAALWPPVMTDGANRPGRKFNWRFRETSMLVWFLTPPPGPATRPHCSHIVAGD